MILEVVRKVFKKNRIKLEEKIEEVIKRDDIQRGYPTYYGLHTLKLPAEPGAQKNVTWCNRFYWLVAYGLGFDTDYILVDNPYTKHILDPSIGWTTATGMYIRATVSAEKEADRIAINCEKRHIFTVNEYWANVFANMGYPVLCAAKSTKPKKSGHVAVVFPEKKYNKEKGLLIAQAGWKVGIFREREMFNVSYLTPIKHFVITKKRKGQ